MDVSIERPPLGRKVFHGIQIAKVPLCLLIGFSTFFGHVFAQGSVTWSTVYSSTSLFLLACGGASFNSYQERFRDAYLMRTEDRPLVKGKVTQRFALIQAGVLVALGLAIIYQLLNGAALVAALVGIGLYNLVYTKMKPWTVLAIIPGALCGAMPPYIGWLAANGDPLAFEALLLVSLLVFWQIPHFFLILLSHRHDYLQSIDPNLLKILREAGLKRVFLPWITALVLTMFCFTTIPSELGFAARAIIIMNGVLLLFQFYRQFLVVQTPQYAYLFRGLNFSLFLFMLVICLGGTTPL